jgi:hypothetical protein
LVRYQFSEEIGPLHLTSEPIDLSQPLALEISESDGVVSFRAKQQSDELVLDATLDIDWASVNQSIFIGEIVLFSISSGGAIEPSEFSIDDFNVDADCL